MEAPTTRRAAAARAGFSSARMMEAQRAFQSVVKQELQLLLEGGARREDAVKLLLRRIVASTETPESAAVRGVMRQFQMNYDDAVRALIVKQELGRLKRQGLDSFAAIEELTRKMRSREVEQGAEGGEKEVEQMAEEVEHKDILVEEKEEEGEEEEEKEEEKEKENDGQEATESQSERGQTPMPAAEMASPTSEKDGNESSLSLCQRIGQVSISSGNTPERDSAEERDDDQEAVEDTDGEENESAGEKNKAAFKSPLRVRSPSSSNLADLTPQSRKRRAAFGIQYDSASNSRNNSTGCSVKPLFPSLKKQKLCAEVGDGFLQVVTRKSKPTSSTLSKSAAAAEMSGSSPSGGKGGGSTRGDHSSKNLHKRQRISPAGMQDDDESPIAEELRVSHVHHRHHAHHHHNKRQKSSSSH
ncbi:hypothetical protein PF005_g8274 [Phytophthora fragariae]|uniref:Uncharacterized protein n=1 Tax=Phytophthora fragariae TaxID=53985 RepID=A0A6A3ZSP4_9STRA|nr:hypothetical protein PF003_g8687 [Phytophthora fragariae]KAE8941143.1 hypothetical protein PF009_g9062 [Phytophthora fragariae]KAE9118942.1 hypothetical protein PF007_g8747 [Phytophthora fragariae]KAE9147598.1 hypothetical protein PF006_g7744 [Phytophthora fragariae]KAE9218443.1 hypothetical protein PF005_g8274 [Phytophthora fragariae]